MTILNTALTVQAASNIFVGSGTLGSATSTIYFCNRGAAATAFNLYLVPAGSIANANNIIYSSKLIQSNDTYVMDMEKLFLGPNDTLRANANVGDSIVATVSSIGV